MHLQCTCMVEFDDIIEILMPWMMIWFIGFISTFDVNAHVFLLGWI